MKTLKQILKETNVSAGIGVRGFGDVTGMPSTGGEEQENSHIERVMQGADENNQQVQSLISNHTDGLYTFDDPNWWENAKGMLQRKLANIRSRAKQLSEGMEKDHYKAIDDVHENLENRNHAIDEYGYGPLNPNEPSNDFWKEKAKLWETSVEEAKKSRCGNCAAFNQSKEILDRIAKGLGPAGKVITEKADLGFCEMFHFKCAAARTCDAWLMNGPISEEIGGAVAGGGSVANAAGSGNIAALGVPLEGKPSNWAEPGLTKAAQRKHQKLAGKTILRRRSLEDLDTIPIAEEYKTGMFAGEQTIIVPTKVFHKARLEKSKGRHWRTYIEDEEFSPSIRAFVYGRKPHSPIIFEDELTGAMCYARYPKKKR